MIAFCYLNKKNKKWLMKYCSQIKKYITKLRKCSLIYNLIAPSKIKITITFDYRKNHDESCTDFVFVSKSKPKN